MRSEWIQDGGPSTLIPPQMLAPLLLLITAAPATSAAAPATAAPATPPSDAELTNRLATRLEALAAARRFSGELRVSRGNQVLVHRGFGGVVVTPGRPGVYVIASITKTFTAAGVLLLAQQGRLRLDDSLARHFPEVDAGRLTRDGRAVTLDDLLTQTSGLAGMDLRPLWASTRPPDTAVRLLSQAHLATTPGREFAYCNQCYVVLGEVVRRVSGARSYDQFVRQNIARPLGLVDTGIVPGEDQRGRLLPGQVGSEIGLHHARRLMPHRLRDVHEWPGAAQGGLRSTAPDLERFFVALVAGKLIGPALRDDMFTEKLDGYARGLVISHLGPGRQLVWHNGGLVPLGYEAFAGVLLGPDREQPPLALVVLGNVDMSAVDLTAEVLRVLSGRPPPPFERWTFMRTMNTVRALQLGPLLATAVVAGFLWRWRRPAPGRAHTLTAMGVVLAVVPIGLAGARTPVFAGTLLFVLIAGAVELRRPPERPWTWSDPASLASLIVLSMGLAVVAFVVLVRFLIS
jgi:D-alanyl-D-alanine carboxypeptidase